MPDIIDIEIQDDGTIKFTTDKISDVNHLSADEFLTEAIELAGGEHKKIARKHKHGSKVHKHAHAHGHAHHH